MESRLIISKNVDKSTDQQNKVIEIMSNQPDNYLAILLQDCPSSDPALVPNSTNLHVARHTASLDKLTTNMTMIINTDKCHIANIGTYEAAGQAVKIYLTPNGYETNKVFLLFNIYLRPRASYQETNELLKEVARLSENKFSKTIIAGDLNATSASWDPQNLKNASMAGKYRAIYETKLLRGNVIEYFARRHGLTPPLQNNGKPIPTFVNPENSNQAAHTESWIDAVFVGSKARRIWYGILVSDQEELANRRHHRTLTIQNTKTQQNRPFQLCPRYQPNRISEEHLLELKFKNRKLRNNWRQCSRDTQIDRLEQLTNLTMTQIKRTQDIQAKIMARARAMTSVSEIAKRLQKVERRNRRRVSHARTTTTTMKTIRRVQAGNHRHRKTKNKLINLIRKRVGNCEEELWTRVSTAQRDLETTNTETTGNHIETLDQLNELAGRLFPQVERQIPVNIMEQHQPILLEEQKLRAAEAVLRNKKYTGPDGIRFSTFNRILALEPEIIRDIASLSFATGHIPEHCRQT